MTTELTTQKIREAGGIVHSDGNVFFTRAAQVQDLIDSAIAADRAARGVPVAIVDSGLLGGIGWTEFGNDLEDGQELFTHPSRALLAAAWGVPQPQLDTELIGVRGGVEVSLGMIATPPRMKAKELARETFGPLKDDDYTDASLCYAAMELLIEHMEASGWKMAAPQPAEPMPSIFGLERCEFDDECDFCESPELGSYTRLTHNYEDCTEAEFYICGSCVAGAIPPKRVPQPAAQPSPVASVRALDEYGPLLDWYVHWKNFPVGTNFYAEQPAAQPERKPMTQEQVDDLAEDGVFLRSVYEIVCAVEAAHGIKDTP